MELVGTLRSVQIGRVKTQITNGESWNTGYFKNPVRGPVTVTHTGIETDEQAELKNHGGPEKALCAYSTEHETFWLNTLGLKKLPDAPFGENLSIEGISEVQVCVGDRHQIGSVVLEVAQPRIPCWKISKRLENPDALKQVVTSRFTGWYYRVIQTGSIRAYDSIFLIDRPFPKLTVDLINQCYFEKSLHHELRSQLLACSKLSEQFKRALLPKH